MSAIDDMRNTLAQAGITGAKSLVMAYGPAGRQVYMIDQGGETKTFIRPAGESSDDTTGVLLAALAKSA